MPSPDRGSPTSASTSTSRGPIAASVGSAVAIAVAGVLSSARSDIGTTNVALVLVGVVVCTAIVSRVAGVIAALVAALGFNFFHTRPYHSLQIHDGRDVLTVVLLVLLGLLASTLGASRRRAGAAARRRLESERGLADIAAMVVAEKSIDDVWSAVRQAIVDELRLADCRFHPRPTVVQPAVGRSLEPAVDDLPLVHRSGALPTGSITVTRDGVLLPSAGAAVDVSMGRRHLGTIELVPGDHSASRVEQRRVVIALADLFALALERQSATSTPRPSHSGGTS